MNKKSIIFVAGHRGLVGSALVRNLQKRDYVNLLMRTHAERDLANQRKLHEAKICDKPAVSVWGTDTPRRESLYSDDMADACVFLANLPVSQFDTLLGSDEAEIGVFMPPLVNIGVGEDPTIRQLSELIKDVIGFRGNIVFDTDRPDGTPRKLLDVTRLVALGWQAKTPLRQGLVAAYQSFMSMEDA